MKKVESSVSTVDYLSRNPQFSSLEIDVPKSIPNSGEEKCVNRRETITLIY